MNRISLIIISALMAFSAAAQTEYHVSQSKGDDRNKGTAERPFKTIMSAARVAMAGDVITVHEGVYRERVVPPRGGTSDRARITYQAAPGERVVITGSEKVDGWKKVGENTWSVTLPNSFFGENNPFDEQLYGSWYHGHGRPNHTGSVYLNGKRLREIFSKDEVLRAINGDPKWYAEADGNGGPVLMNFEWARPSKGKKLTSMQASVENGDQAICIAIIDRWPFGYLKDGSVMHFDGLDFGEKSDTLYFQAATLAKGGIVEMRLDTADGEYLGCAMVTNTGDWENFAVFPLKMTRPLSGKHNICLITKAPAQILDGKTTIWAQFPAGTDPNNGSVEVAVRPQVFYPDYAGVNYITVRGFVMENAATNWAPPSAEQPGLIGTRWAKGWIIENNVIRNSRCAGVALGRSTFGHSHHYQTLPPEVYAEPNGGQTVEQLKDYFENASWNKEETGFHIVRGNHIYECGQVGIVGCSGAAFSLIEDNEIHDICIDETFTGEEMAGIKLHFAVDAILRNNHIYRTIRGMWLDWGPQGIQVTGNLFHDNNDCEDLFMEVCHGPALVANNIFLSPNALNLSSQGVACVHNLINGKIGGGRDRCAGGRLTYVYKPHSTTSVGKVPNPGGDLQCINNLITADADFDHFDEPGLPIRCKGNVAAAESGFNPDVKLVEKEDGWYLTMGVSEKWKTAEKRAMVKSSNLDKAQIPDQAFTNPDGSPFQIDRDYMGVKRKGNPYPGAIEVKKNGANEWKVWPKK
ncbi:MAG: carbohydrate-binding protein [Muribaculaceae bacterium]